MATKTFEELKQLAIQIRDEKTNKQNTATRIGTQMLEHLNKLEQDYYDKTATDEELKQRDEKLAELSSKDDKIYLHSKNTELKLGEKAISVEDNYDDTLDICDEDGNVAMSVDKGHIITKNFNSSKSPKIENVDDTLDICDEDGNVAMSVDKGHIITKNFDSSKILNINSLLLNKRISILGDSISTFCYTLSGRNPSLNPSDVSKSEFMGCQNVHGNYIAENNTDVKTSEDTWWGQLAQKTGAVINYVRAIGSASVTGQLYKLANDLHSARDAGEEPDIVFIFCGTNDVNTPNNIGTREDFINKDYTTFYGAYLYLLDDLQKTYPHAEIVALTPIYSAYDGVDEPPYNAINSISHNNREMYVNAIIDCCNAMCVKYINLYNLCNFNRYNYTDLMFDETHPRKKGMTMIADAISNNINNLINF